MIKHIFVTGGVVSSLGKGLTSASIGLLLEKMGFKINMQKFDPYINVDPGTMNPYQHGEVYVTEDGMETDLDIGHYERFTNARITECSNYTTGRIYSAVISKEREGKYLGQTVQVIPHITNEIKDAIRRLDEPDVDVAITEIGGTVGDIESLPFLEAIRQFRLDYGGENVLYIHLTLIPYLRTSDEMKTKPTQQSVGRLREIGIQPDILICRTEKPLTEEVKAKLSLFCNVPREYVIEEKDVDYTIYEIPIMLYSQGLDLKITKKLGISSPRPNLLEWQKMVDKIKNPKKTVTIAMVGKYLELVDSYKSIHEALAHCGIANDCRIKIKKIPAEDVEENGISAYMEGVSGVLVPGGFGTRGVEGKIKAANFARTHKIPYLGLCLGMQTAVIEFARNVIGLKSANSREFDKDTPYPVIDIMESQKNIKDKGGTMRLGSYRCKIERGSRAFEAYKQEIVSERHRHRYEFNNRFKEDFIKYGMQLTGICPDNNLVEIVEIKDHPWFVGVQFHPEFKSKPISPHPLFRDFISSCLAFSR
jgi:CTP synthase